MDLEDVYGNGKKFKREKNGSSKDAYLNARITSEKYNIYRTQASVCGMSIGEFVRKSTDIYSRILLYGPEQVLTELMEEEKM